MIALPSDSFGASYEVLPVHHIVGVGFESTSHNNLKREFLVTDDGPDIFGVLGGSVWRAIFVRHVKKHLLF